MGSQQDAEQAPGYVPVPNHPVEREWLAGVLWPDIAPSQAAANMRPVLSNLREALREEGKRLESPDRHTLVLNLADDQETHRNLSISVNTVILRIPDSLTGTFPAFLSVVRIGNRGTRQDMTFEEGRLVQRLHRRAQRRARTGEPAETALPATAQAVALAEEALGFALPPLLSALYREIGDGGWGPGVLPLLGVPDAQRDARLAKGDDPWVGFGVVTLYRYLQDVADTERCHNLLWPNGLLPLFGSTSEVRYCVDVKEAALPVIAFYPSLLEFDEEGRIDPLAWRRAFVRESESLVDWLAADLERRRRSAISTSLQRRQLLPETLCFSAGNTSVRAFRAASPPVRRAA